MVDSGSARVVVGDDVVELSEWDAVRVPAGVLHGFEGAGDGAAMQPGWWPEAD